MVIISFTDKGCNDFEPSVLEDNTRMYDFSEQDITQIQEIQEDYHFTDRSLVDYMTKSK
jgi:hypothetical protein